MMKGLEGVKCQEKMSVGEGQELEHDSAHHDRAIMLTQHQQCQTFEVVLWQSSRYTSGKERLRSLSHTGQSWVEGQMSGHITARDADQ